LSESVYSFNKHLQNTFPKRMIFCESKLFLR